jgi:3-deoxy-manno-octulosonate cytidylyltransferase (CMP-KDO synthetase)
MTSLPACFGIIPARYASSRFPGKPLVPILGKPMFWHVYQRARQCPALSRVVLATDDPRIAAAAEKWQVPVVMTRCDHPSGTDRVLEAAEQLAVPDNAVVVNIQGDEPALEPSVLTALLTPFEAPATRVTTLARELARQEADNPDRVKVVFGIRHQALYFSRAPIPFERDGHPSRPCYGHIGLYAFRLETLRQFVALGPSPLETTEKLEQLRLLENGIPIQVVLTRHQSIGVDRPDDVATVTRILAAGSPSPDPANGPG